MANSIIKATSKINPSVRINNFGGGGQGAATKGFYIRLGNLVYVYAWIQKTDESWNVSDVGALPSPTTKQRIGYLENYQPGSTDLSHKLVQVNAAGTLVIESTNVSTNTYVVSGFYYTS